MEIAPKCGPARLTARPGITTFLEVVMIYLIEPNSVKPPVCTTKCTVFCGKVKPLYGIDPTTA